MMNVIKDSIGKILKTNFPDHKIYDEKVVQGLKRPCFFVELIPVSIGKINPNMQERSMIIDIQYMSREDTKEKNLEMAELLGVMFDTIKFNNLQANPSEERFEIIDGILHYLFDLEFILIGQHIEEGIPPMKDLNLNQEVLRWGSHM